eukprot:6905278-Pyramimonas_sp.AAC.1
MHSTPQIFDVYLWCISLVYIFVVYLWCISLVYIFVVYLWCISLSAGRRLIRPTRRFAGDGDGAEGAQGDAAPYVRVDALQRHARADLAAQLQHAAAPAHRRAGRPQHVPRRRPQVSPPEPKMRSSMSTTPVASTLTTLAVASTSAPPKA